MIRQSEKSCKEGVCSIQCFRRQHAVVDVSAIMHIFRTQGYFYLGGMYFQGFAAGSKFHPVKNEGYLFSEGYLFMGFYGIAIIPSSPVLTTVLLSEAFRQSCLWLHQSKREMTQSTKLVDFIIMIYIVTELLQFDTLWLPGWSQMQLWRKVSFNKTVVRTGELGIIAILEK